MVSDEFRMEWRKTRNIQKKTKISQSVWLWAVVPQTAGMRPRRGRDGALSLRWHPRFRVWTKGVFGTNPARSGVAWVDRARVRFAHGAWLAARRISNTGHLSIGS